MRAAIRRTIVAVAGVTTLAGCASQVQFERLSRESTEREQRLVAVEETLGTQRQGLEEASSEAQVRVQELREVLEQATQAVTRNSADLGTEVQQLRADIARLEGQLAELRNDLATARGGLQQRDQELDASIRRLASHAGIDLSLDESEIPDDPAGHYQAAYQAYQQRDFPRARSLFRLFVARHASHAKADDALFYSGMSFMQQSRPQNALASFQRILQDYRTGDMVDDTLFQMGEAFFQIGACTEARTAFEALLQGHRDSPHAAEARQRLRAVRSANRSQCTAN